MKVKKIPLRQCAVCREQKPKSEMIRVIRTPEGNICIDVTGRQNGRGAYICSGTQCLKKAISSKALDRVLKERIPGEVYDELERQTLEIEE